MTMDETGLVAGFYEAAFDATLFPDRLRQLGEFSGGVGAILLLWNKRAGHAAWLATSGHTGPDAPDAYTRHYAALDPYRPLVETMPLGTWSTSSDLFDDGFIAKSAFFNEYLIPRGTRYMAGCRVMEEADFNAFLGIHRAPGQAPFGADELRQFEAVGRHLGRALKVYCDVTHARLGHGAALAVLDHSATPSLLVDGAARLLFANAPAEALLQADTGLGLQHGRLTTTRSAEDHRLRRLLAAATGADGRQRMGGEMAVVRTDGRPPITVLVTPIGPTTTLNNLAPVSAALVLVHDPARQLAHPSKRLRARFGLTQAETALAHALLDGKRLAEIATERGVSIETVRTQLRALFRKTGVSRQADLMRLLLAVPQQPPTA